MKSPIDVLVIGHLTVDLVPGGKILGGTVSYAAPTYAALGHQVGILTSAAFDETLIGDLLPYGELVMLPAQSSLTYENVYSEVGRQQFVRTTAKQLSAEYIPSGWMGAPLMHLGPLAAELDPLAMARRFNHATVMLTLQGMMRRWESDGLVKFRRWFDGDALRLIDIIIYSEEDIQAYPQLTDEIRQFGNHLVVTNGRAGGTYYRGSESWTYDSIDVTATDLTGAGDVFAACLLGLLPLVGFDFRKAVPIAGRLAAYSVTRSGIASAPTASEIARELNESDGTRA